MKKETGDSFAKSFRDRLPVRIAAVCFWLLVWELAALSLHSDLLLVSPLHALKRLLELAAEPVFLRAVWGSFHRIALGFLSGMLLGAVLAIAAARLRLVRDLLAPAVLAVKSVPVASFVILALIWFRSRRLSTVISFLIVLPVVYTGVLEGALQIDRNLEEMADVFRLPSGRRLRYLRLPQIYPYLTSSCRLALGMAWKSGIAAEVIGLPSGTIGERLQQAKIYLNTPDLFAWTLAIIFLSFITEKAFLWLLQLLFAALTRMPAQPSGGAAVSGSAGASGYSYTGTGHPCAGPSPAISIDRLCKGFDGVPVISDLTAEIPAGTVTCLMGPSGIGKTTLLRILAGLEQADSGQVSPAPMEPGYPPVSMVFQEDRLIDGLSVLSNLRLTAPALSDDAAAAALEALALSPELLHRRAATLSGGMKRRVALLRALLADGSLLLLDEPFTGLDEDTRDIVLRKLPALAGQRTVVLVTHDAADAEQLVAEVITLA